ncbi:MAG: glutamate racemase [Acidobacteriota bacterium]|nr:glutamate racemase [Acidobacteriota bacterium]
MSSIGVFDSGVGGLTVVAALRRRLPGESILYLGDTARLPYGTKSADTVVRYTQRNLAFLASRGVKAIVVACNTASALALDRVETSLPVWGVIEPGAQEAARVSSGSVGILATETTIRSGAYPRALSRIRPELEVQGKACPLFVPLVEEGWEDDPVTFEIARRYLDPLLESGVDTMVLGCTHYPLLEPTIRRVTGSRIQLVSSAEEAAAHVAEDLARLGLRENSTDAAGEARVDLCMTDSASRFESMARRILGELETPPEHVNV